MLSHLYPRPQPVTLGDDARPRLALPLRLRDLADLEALALAHAPDPLAGLPDADADTPEHRAALVAAMDEAERPTGWGSAFCAAVVLGTVEGRAGFLCAVLRLDGLTLDDARDLVPTVTPEQWARLDRVAFGSDPAAELVRRGDALLGIEAPAGRVPWAEAVVETWQSAGGTPEAWAWVADLTLPQFRAIRAGGKPQNPWGDDDTPQEVTERRRELWGSAALDAATTEAGPHSPCGPTPPEPPPEPDAPDLWADRPDTGHG